MSDSVYNGRDILALANQYNNFGVHIGIEMVEVSDGRATARMVLDERHFNPIGSVHGGCIFSLADTVAGAAAFSLGKCCTTLSAHTSFLKAAMTDRSHVLYGRAVPVRIGNKIAVYRVLVTDDLENEIAEFTIEFYRMSRLPEMLQGKLG